jgi:ATP-dependent RNA helicase DDX1
MATAGVRSGKFFFECTMRDSGLARVGVGSTAAALDLGTCPQGFGFGGTGKRSNNRRFDPYGEPFGSGDVIGVAVDLSTDRGTVRFLKNGVNLGEAFEIPPKVRPLYPMVCLKNAEVSVNLGQTRFSFPPPAGFHALMSGDASLDLVDTTAEEAASSSSSKENKPIVLILEPTIDLADQTFRAMQAFSAHVRSPPVRCVLVAGGADIKATSSALRSGKAEIVVGTPSRVMDMATSGGGVLDLSGICVFILDEADRLYHDKDDRERIDRVWKMLGRDGDASERLQVCFFSATLHSPEIAVLSEAVCHNPTWIDLKGKDSVPETVHHAVLQVDPRTDLAWSAAAGSAVARFTDELHSSDRLRPLRSVTPDSLSPEEVSEGIKRLKLLVLPDLLDALGKDQCMIFCRTNMDCESVCAYLEGLGGSRGFSGKMETGKENPYSAVMVGGAIRPQDRKANLQAFQDGDVRCLVCTDAVARGIDVKGLPFMINFTLPDEPEQYIHRTGRVGRAERMGLAVSLVAAPECRERVWFLQKGKKLARGNIPSNRKDYAQGGNCVWYDEPAYLRAIEARLSKVKDSDKAAASSAPAVHIARLQAWKLAADTGAAVALEVVRAAIQGAKLELRLKDSATGAPLSSAPSGRPLLYAVGFPASILDIEYGESKSHSGGTSAHLIALKPIVETLGDLEQRAQLAYLSLQQAFGVVKRKP